MPTASHARGLSSWTASATRATSPRGATWALTSPTRWAAKRPRGCRHPPHRAHRGGRSQGPTAGGVRAGTRGARRAHHVLDGRLRYRPRAAHPTANDRLRLLDSPVALAAWMLDHDTDSYYKISRAFVDGEPVGNLTRDNIVDDITLYWLTGTGASAAGGTGSSDDKRPQPLRPARLRRRSRFRSPTRTSPAKSSLPRAAGSRWFSPASPTSTKSTGAVTSPPGRSPSSSRPRCGQRSARCDSKGGSYEHCCRHNHGYPHLPHRHRGRADRRPPPTHRRDPTAQHGARPGPLPGRAARDDPRARALLGRGLRLRPDRGETERAPAVHDRDRRGRDTLHPRAL